MKQLFIWNIVFLLSSCGSSIPKNENVIGSEDVDSQNTSEIIKTTPIKKAPRGAVFGNYNGDKKSFYSHVRAIDKRKGTMVVAFEQRDIPPIIIDKAYAGEVSTIQLDGFDRDLLLIATTPQDPIFKKYYLYVLRNNQWKKVVNGFTIHESHFNEVVKPIKVDPKNNDHLTRYYSVFNLDAASANGYSWLLQTESVPIEHR